MANDHGIFAELKRRHVVRVAIAYAIAGWLIVQVASQVFSAFHMPDWTAQFVMILVAIGFPVAVGFAWVFELTPEGLRRTAPADSPEARNEPQHHSIGQKLNVIIIVVLVLAVAVTGWRLYAVKHPKPSVAVTVTTPGVAAAPGHAAQAVSSGRNAQARAIVPVPAASIPEKSVAVLPFVNESGKKDQQYFSDGLSEDLITALSQFEGLKVISRASAFQFRHSKDTVAQIGKLLGVAHLLEGSVQRAGDQVRITATLVNAADGRVIWSNRYDKPYKDLFALQDAITKAVADALKAKLLTAPGAVVQTDRPPSGNLKAYAAYEHGRAYDLIGTEASTRRAIAAYRDAIQHDPRYAAAYARLCLNWATLAAQFDDVDATRDMAKARDASANALRLDPDLALVHSVQATLYLVDVNWAGAEREAQRAVELAPNDAHAFAMLANVLAAQGQNRRAVKLARKVVASDPRSAYAYLPLSTILAALGKLDAATEALDKAIALRPGAATFYASRTVIDILRGNAQAALADARKEPSVVWRAVGITLALQVGANRAAADGALKRFVAKYAAGAPYQIAEMYALRHDPDAMFKWLDRAWVARDSGIDNLLSDPFILRYRNDPRFAAFCKKVGLPTTTDAVAMQ